MQASIMKAAKIELSAIFQTSFDSLKASLKCNSYVLFVHVSTKMAHNKAVDDLCNQSIKR